MDSEAARQELQSYIHGRFIYNTEIKQAAVVDYLRHLDPSLDESDIVYLIRNMAANGVFHLAQDENGNTTIKLPSS